MQESKAQWIEYHKGLMNFIDWDKFNEFDMLKIFIEVTFLNNENLATFINSIDNVPVRETLGKFFQEVDKAAYDFERDFAMLQKSEFRIRKSVKQKSIKERLKEVGLVGVTSNAPKGTIVGLD